MLPITIDLNTAGIFGLAFGMILTTGRTGMGAAFALYHRTKRIRRRAIRMTGRMHHRNSDESKHTEGFSKSGH